MTTIGTRLFTILNGKLEGKDEFGNRYFSEKHGQKGKRTKRWVIYKDKDDASNVPASWHGWLHHIFDATPIESEQSKNDWEKSHIPNLTGTSEAYRPPGHILKGGQRSKATGDYESWKPE